MPKKDTPEAVMEIVDEGEETAPQIVQAPEPPPRAPSFIDGPAPPEETFETESAPKAPSDIGSILAELQKGAVKGLIIPKAAAEAQDWSEKIGAAIKSAMEAPPQGTQVRIERIERAFGGSYYSITLRGPRGGGTGSLQTSEFCHLCSHDPGRLGRWLRQFGNVLIGRPRNT